MILGTESFPRQAYASWAPVEKHSFVIGDFVWTGMDHLGESSIGNAQLNTPAGRGGGGPGAGRPVDLAVQLQLARQAAGAALAQPPGLAALRSPARVPAAHRRRRQRPAAWGQADRASASPSPGSIATAATST